MAAAVVRWPSRRSYAVLVITMASRRLAQWIERLIRINCSRRPQTSGATSRFEYKFGRARPGGFFRVSCFYTSPG